MMEELATLRKETAERLIGGAHKIFGDTWSMPHIAFWYDLEDAYQVMNETLAKFEADGQRLLLNAAVLMFDGEEVNDN